jgi:hypothetical protein
MKYLFRFILSVSILFYIYSCSSASERITRTPENELIKDLTSRLYQYYKENIGLKTKEFVQAIEITDKSIIQSDELMKICSIRSLKFMVIRSGGKFPAINDETVEVCKKSNLNSILINYTEMDNLKICQIAKGLISSKVRLDFNHIGLSDNVIECVSTVKNLDSLLIGPGSKITDEGMCKFTENAKNLTFLRMDDITNLTKTSLDCMLNLPSLNMVMLQRWKKVPESQMEKFVKSYETKYKRKIDAGIYDPTSYEKP